MFFITGPRALKLFKNAVKIELAATVGEIRLFLSSKLSISQKS